MPPINKKSLTVKQLEIKFITTDFHEVFLIPSKFLKTSYFPSFGKLSFPYKLIKFTPLDIKETTGLVFTKFFIRKK